MSETKKRERLEVIRDILVAIKHNRSIKPTRLMYASNLSPQMFKDYITELIEKKFVKFEAEGRDEDKKEYTLTKKGMDFLNEFKVIENFVQNFGL
jgi:predicted transcriptional regulator